MGRMPGRPPTIKTIIGHRCFLEPSFCLPVLNYLPSSCGIFWTWESGVAAGSGGREAELMAFSTSRKEKPSWRRAGRSRQGGQAVGCLWCCLMFIIPEIVLNLPLDQMSSKGILFGTQRKE